MKDEGMKMVTREKVEARTRANKKRVRRARSLAELVRGLRAKMPEMSERYGVQSLGVFGSYLRGDQKARSDFDVLVEFDSQQNTFHNWIELRSDLQDALGVKVDLIENKNLKPFIGKRILSEVVWLRRDGKDLRVRVGRRKQGGFRMAKKREYLDFMKDIVQAMERAEQYTMGKTFDEFMQNNMAVDALSKVIENIGEAVKHIPNDVRQRYPELDWKNMAGTRDHIVHGYFAVNYAKLWEIATVLIPTKRPIIAAALEQELKRRADQDAKKENGKKNKG